MKQIQEIFKDYGIDCDLDLNLSLLFYNDDNEIIHIEHSGKSVIDDYFENTVTSTKDGVQTLTGQETISVLFEGDYSLALETIIDLEKNDKRG